MTEGTTIGYATMPIIPSLRGAEAAIDRQLDGIMGTVGRKAGSQLGDGMVGGLRNAGRQMAQVAGQAAAAATASLVAGGVAASTFGLKLAAANEQAEISFTTMLGSAEKAQAFLGDMRDFAAKTPFEFPELQTAASSLVSAGVEASKVIPIMTTLGDVTAGMGTGSEGIKRATVAIQQMQAAGKITGEDLNQLRDAGVPVYDLLAAATGRAKSEVVSLAQAGKLGKNELDQLMKALETGAGLERFAGLMDAQSQSLSGMVSTLKDVVGQDLATAMEPGVAELKKMLPPITDAAHALILDLAPSFTKAFQVAGAIVPKVLDHLDEGLDLLHEYGPALSSVLGGFTAMGAGSLPILGQFLPSINPVVAGITALALSTPEARDALADLARELSPLVAELVQELLPILGDLTQMAQDLLPSGITVASAAVQGLLAVLVPTTEAVSALTGFLAEHEEVTIVLTGVILAYAAAQGVAAASNTALVGSIVTGFVAAQSAQLSFFATASTLSTVQQIKALGTAVTNMATTTVSGAAIAGGALAGIAIGAGIANKVMDDWADKGKERAAKFAEGLSYDAASLDSLTGYLAEVGAKSIELQELMDSGSTGYAEDQRLGNEIIALRDTVTDLSPKVRAASLAMADFNKATGLTKDQTENLVKAAGLDLLTAFDENGKAVPQLVAKWTELSDTAALAGQNIKTIEMTPEQVAKLEADGKAVQAAMDAVAGSFSDFGDVLSLGPGDDENPINSDAIKTFYKDTIKATEDFSEDVRTAIALGYDPEFVARLLAAGPEQAGPILETLVESASASFVEMVNSAEGELAELSANAVRMAQLTQQAINDGGQQMAEDLGTAQAIALAVMDQGTKGTIASVAEAAGVTISKAREVMAEFQIELDQIRSSIEGLNSLGEYGSIAPGFANAERENLHGGVYAFAGGGMTPAHVAMGTRYKWAEPQTGGEAFLPRLGNQSRNEDLMRFVAAQWYGGQFTSAKELAKRPGYAPAPGVVPQASTPSPPRRRRVGASRDVHFHHHGTDTSTVVRDALWELD